MAKTNATTNPVELKDQATGPMPDVFCNHCRRPAVKPMLAGDKPYCGKLCAALGLIIEVHCEDVIDSDFDFLESIVADCYYKGSIPIPVKVRYQDALDAYDFDGFPSAPAGTEYRMVVIGDEGTPDWRPDPSLCPSEDEVDRVVSNLLHFPETRQ
jgi:hypothetical protein